MQTHEVAEQAGVNTQTLRYYERRGLLTKPPRSPAGYRDYPTSAVDVLRFVKRAQELGFSLAEVEELLALADGGPDGCDAARALDGLLTGRDDVVVEHEVIRDEREAAARCMTGSPTLLIDGIDPFSAGRPSSMSCRVYLDESGAVVGAPSVAQLREALASKLAPQAAAHGR